MSDISREEYRELIDSLHRIEMGQQSLTQDLRGNGQPGIIAQMRDVQEWVKKRPQECPAIIRRRSATSVRLMEATVMATVIMGVDLVLKLLHVL